MKWIATVFSVVMASMLSSATAILGEEYNPVPFGSYGKGMQSNHKNQCLLVAKSCATKSDTVLQRLNDLRNEIAKGYRVYTPTELNWLKEQLKFIVSESDNTTI